MTDFTIYLAKIQSIGQRLDHLALTTLPEEHQERYLIERNRYSLDLERSPLLEFAQATVQKETVRTEILDQDETQIVQRFSAAPLPASIEYLSQALDQDFQQTELWVQRSQCWISRRDYAAAMSDIMRAHRLSPTDLNVQKIIRQMKEIYEQEGKNFPLTSF